MQRSYEGVEILTSIPEPYLMLTYDIAKFKKNTKNFELSSFSDHVYLRAEIRVSFNCMRFPFFFAFTVH